jgi:4-diphosphocytidyl-2-C-methyl-D-erythritol kinase
LRELVDAVAQAVSDGDPSLELAPAKINLALHVVSRRSDGYHLIDSLVVFADYNDTVRAVPSHGRLLEISLDGHFGDELDLLSHSRDNLVIRAAEALFSEAGKRRVPSTHLVLTKRIPIAAGLGGGSADAAATLRLLNRYWRLGIDDGRLARIGLGLGADVPMCLMPQPVIARGIGERLMPLVGIPPLPIVLAHPSIPLSTASVYRRLVPAERPPLPPMPARFDSVIAFAIWLRQTRNDLVEPARAETGLADAATRALSSDPDCLFARMSGSGATAFGIFPKLSSAVRAAEKLRQKRPNWWVAAVETIGS